MAKCRVLFLCKSGQGYGEQPYHRKFSGLLNSTKFVAKALNEDENIKAEVRVIVDANAIDRELADFKPQLCVLEALWVPPAKFDELRPLHPKVKFYVRLHSDIPFLSHEGMAVEWIREYLVRGVGIIANSKETKKAIKYAISEYQNVVFLPNPYEKVSHKRKKDKTPYLAIGCFGAIRPLKNQLIQAIAAFKVADEMNLPLQFNINSTRVEGNGGPILKNLRALFANHHQHLLIEHAWMDHEEFKETIKSMDLVSQVSYSETFCMVAADAISVGVPVVGSEEIEWLSNKSQAKPNDVDDIIEKMKRALKNDMLLWFNQVWLNRHTEEASEKWIDFVIDVCRD